MSESAKYADVRTCQDTPEVLPKWDFAAVEAALRHNENKRINSILSAVCADMLPSVRPC
jgi:hypothetical protein